MSNSTPSAWRPEIIRRPNMNAARAKPTASTAATSSQSCCSSFDVSACWRAAPVRYAIAIAASCEPTARNTDTTSDHRYGRRNESRRANVWRYGTATYRGYRPPLALNAWGAETRPVPETRYAKSGDV